MSDASPGRKRWLERWTQNTYDHLIRPFLLTHDPLAKVAWGASIGMFVALTPTVGVQMYIVTLIWLLCRYALRFRFNLTIAISLVWITNPVTTVPIYFLFLKTGDGVLGMLGYAVREMTFEIFQQQVTALGHGQELDWLHWLIYATEVFLVEFGWPMVIGSMVYAVPSALLAYPATFTGLRRYRQYLARQQGITYAEWRERYEAKR